MKINNVLVRSSSRSYYRNIVKSLSGILSITNNEGTVLAMLLEEYVLSGRVGNVLLSRDLRKRIRSDMGGVSVAGFNNIMSKLRGKGLLVKFSETEYEFGGLFKQVELDNRKTVISFNFINKEG